MGDVKLKLRRVIQDPRFSRREKDLAESALERIEILENRQIYHWTEMARFALLIEAKDRIIGKQAATKIDSFLKRHRIPKE